MLIKRAATKALEHSRLKNRRIKTVQLRKLSLIRSKTCNSNWITMLLTRWRAWRKAHFNISWRGKSKSIMLTCKVVDKERIEISLSIRLYKCISSLMILRAYNRIGNLNFRILILIHISISWNNYLIRITSSNPIHQDMVAIVEAMRSNNLFSQFLLKSRYWRLKQVMSNYRRIGRETRIIQKN